MGKQVILHVHSDYPDGRKGYPPTKAVENLIRSVDTYDHYVVSIHRTSNIFRYSIDPFRDGISVVYWSIPIPIVYHLSMMFLCALLNFKLRKLKFDLAHGHKLTTDGYVARKLASNKSKPFFISVRGGTDTKNVGRLPDMRGEFKKTLALASFIFWVSPWAREQICSRLGVFPSQEAKLPNPCNLNFQVDESKRSNKGNKLVMIASYAAYKRKAVIEVINAISRLKNSGMEVSLDIFGGGDDGVKTILDEEISRLNLADQIRLRGKVDNKDLLAELPGYSLFVMPSVNETFGMVYVEAAASMVPFIAHSGTGIDGYFDEAFSVYIDSQKPEVIAESIRDTLTKMNEIDISLREYHNSGQFRQFTTNAIVELYTQKACDVLGRS